jgi:hypothetical protein
MNECKESKRRPIFEALCDKGVFFLVDTHTLLAMMMIMATTYDGAVAHSGTLSHHCGSIDRSPSAAAAGDSKQSVILIGELNMNRSDVRGSFFYPSAPCPPLETYYMQVRFQVFSLSYSVYQLLVARLEHYKSSRLELILKFRHFTARRGREHSTMCTLMKRFFWSHVWLVHFMFGWETFEPR